MKVTLKKYDVSSDIFDNLLKKYKKYVKLTDDIQQYFGGYKNKMNIMYDGNQYLICQEYLVDNTDEDSIWKQIIVRKSEQFENQTIKQGVTGSYAWNYMMKMLLKYYTREEIHNCLVSFGALYDPKKIQFHYNYLDMEPITVHQDCYKYDINSAYGYYLKQIFPKASKSIDWLYETRKQHPENKEYMNYFVGMLASKNKKAKYGNTYNWIVQQTRDKLLEAYHYTGGILVYANTDGFVIRKPKRLLETSKTMGDFKLEYQGVAYTHTNKNYSCIQTGQGADRKITGNVLYQVRDLIDLSENKIVSYDRVKKVLGVEDGKEIYTWEAQNVKVEVING